MSEIYIETVVSIQKGGQVVMKILLAVVCAALLMLGPVSPAFSAAAVEYGIIGSKGAPGTSGLGNALNKKFKKLREKMSQDTPSSMSSRPSTSSSVAGKIRVEENKPIDLVPTAGGAVDRETGMFYKDEGGGYYNPETTTFVIRDSSGSKEP